MKLSDFKKQLSVSKTLNFLQPSGESVPSHFHITEVGLMTKHFVDCGNTIHVEKTANMQIWIAEDTEHRLKPLSLLQIIAKSDEIFGDEDLEVEIEFQTETIGKYNLDFIGNTFVLLPKRTDCLAKSTCGVPVAKPKLQLLELASVDLTGCCTPGGGCC
jgi:hypothetical protein